MADGLSARSGAVIEDHYTLVREPGVRLCRLLDIDVRMEQAAAKPVFVPEADWYCDLGRRSSRTSGSWCHVTGPER
ncbi:hypothetical protein GCM10010211_77930 [Streptomyces albospinus]|uniref:Uncharacterized protein n=1 Tax=Streptomyces albospinus TaxID=285515 RepID=A0ABQ2VQN1_9ACTN|nr:hypothetical protein GCM10010211_77930 [Streptomyces albospinus]